MLPTARLAAVWAEAADVLGDRVLSRRGRWARRTAAQRRTGQGRPEAAAGLAATPVAWRGTCRCRSRRPSRSRSWPSRYAFSLLRYSRSNARRSSTRRSSSSRCVTSEPIAWRCRSWASRSRDSARALASPVICSAWRRALVSTSSASRRARPSVSSASRRASAIAWSAVCWASESTRAAVSMLSSAWYGRSIIMGSGRRIGCSIGGSGAIMSGRGSDSGELSAMAGFPPPRRTSASLARSSSFSWINRSSSASTSSRKASTSSSS